MVEIIRLLRAEHRNLGKVLDVLEREIEAYNERGHVNHAIVRDIVDYFRGYPALCHHPKEDLIYGKLRVVAEPAAFDRVCDLVAEHEELGSLTDRLEAAVDNLLSDAGSTRGKFIQVAREFLDRHRRHMDMEEGVLFPVALESLSEADWTEIDHRALEHRGSQLGGLADRRFEALCGEIVEKEQVYQDSWDRMDRVL